MAVTDRRTSCTLCGGRCDPGRYTCRRCCDRLWSGIAADLVDSLWTRWMPEQHGYLPQETGIRRAA